jgi:hypothetical protein
MCGSAARARPATTEPQTTYNPSRHFQRSAQRSFSFISSSFAKIG